MKNLLSLLCAALVSVVSCATSAQIFVYAPTINVVGPAQNRISGIGLQMVVRSSSFCINDRISSIPVVSQIETITQPGRLTVKITGFCPPQFIATDRRVRIDIGSLAPGTYELYFEHYTFDGQLVGSGSVTFSDTNPFTMLAPTDENLRVFAVPTTTQTTLAAMVTALIALSAAVLRRRPTQS